MADDGPRAEALSRHPVLGPSLILEKGLEKVRCKWDNPTMTTITDAKRRVTLSVAKPGDRFDVQVSDDGKVILTLLVPAARTETVRLIKKHGYTVAVGSRRITQEQVRKLLDEFP